MISRSSDDPFHPQHAAFPLPKARLGALLSQPGTQGFPAPPVPDSTATDKVINTAPANEAQLFCEGCQSGWTLITSSYKLREDWELLFLNQNV